MWQEKITSNYVYIINVVLIVFIMVFYLYQRTGFDSEGLTKMATKVVSVIRLDHVHHKLYRSCLPIFIVKSPSFLFFDEFEEMANISVAIMSSSTVANFISKIRFTEEFYQHRFLCTQVTRICHRSHV